MITIDTLVEAKKQDIIDNITPNQLSKDINEGLRLKEDMINAVNAESIKESNPEWKETLDSLNSQNISAENYLKCCCGEMSFGDLPTPMPAKVKTYYRINMGAWKEYKNGETIEIKKDEEVYSIKLELSGELVPTYRMVGIRWRDYPEDYTPTDVKEFIFDNISTFISDDENGNPRDFKSMVEGTFRLMYTLKPLLYSNVSVIGYILFKVIGKEEKEKKSKKGGCCGKKEADPAAKTPSTDTTCNDQEQGTTFGINVNSCYLYNVLVTMWKIFVGGKIVGSCDSGTWIAPSISSAVVSEGAIKNMILASLLNAQGQSGPM